MGGRNIRGFEDALTVEKNLSESGGSSGSLARVMRRAKGREAETGGSSGSGRSQEGAETRSASS